MTVPCHPVYLTALHLDAAGWRFWFRCPTCGRLNSIFRSVLPTWWNRYWCKSGHPLKMILDWRLIDGWKEWYEQNRSLDSVHNPYIREWLREIGKCYEAEQNEQALAGSGGDA
jgi:hypothetical protein